MNFPEPGTVPPVRRFPSLDRRASLPPAVPARDAGAATPHDHRGGARMQTVPTPAPLTRVGERCAPKLRSSAVQRLQADPAAVPLLSTLGFFLSPFIFLPRFSITLSITVTGEPRPPLPRGMSPVQRVISRYFRMPVEGIRREKEKGKEM